MDGAGPLTGRFRRRPALALFAASLSLAPPSASYAQSDLGSEESQRPLQLSIASMHIAGKTIAPAKLQPPPPSWRHTFGSERRAEAVRPQQPVRFSADIVALQGVTSLGSVRQMFPASTYHVIVSRQLLQRPDQVEGRHPPTATTALAIRRDKGLRVTSQDHLLGMADPPPGSAIELAAATAVRLLSGRRALWVVSLDIAQGCPAPDAPPASTETAQVQCLAAKQQLDMIDAWLAEPMAKGETVIVAGRLNRPLGKTPLPGHLGQLAPFSYSGDPPEICVREKMETTQVLVAPGPATDRQVVLAGRLEPVDQTQPEAGCFLMVDARI